MGNWSIITPQDTRNLVRTPIQNDPYATSNWSTSGSSTTARDTATGIFGRASFKVTPTAATTDGMQISLTSADYTAGDVVSAQVWVKGVNAVPYTFYLSNFSGLPLGAGAQTNFTGTGEWQQVKIEGYTLGAGLTDRMYIKKNSSADVNPFWVGAAQVEISATCTTFGYGDMDGWEWEGERFESVSHRLVSARNQGAILDLEDDYGVTVKGVLGGGMPPLKHKTHKSPSIPGALFRGSKPLPRTMQLIIGVNGNNWAGFHQLKKDLVDILKPDRDSVDEELALVYNGSNSSKPITIKVVYDSGLEMGSLDYLYEEISLRVIAYDPFWYEFIHATASVDNQIVTAAPAHFMGRVDGVWDDFNGGFNGTVYAAIILPDKTLVVGGAFTTGNGGTATTLNGLAYWNASTGVWAQIKNGANIGVSGGSATVYALAYNPFNQRLFVGGNFTSICGTAANNIALLQKDTYSAASINTVGTGANNTVSALAFHPKQGYVFVGGAFTSCNGDATKQYLVKVGYSIPASFEDVTTTDPNAAVTCIVAGNDDYVYVGGSFTSPQTRIMYANVSSTSDFGGLSSGLGGTPNALAVAPDGSLYATGNFTTAGGVTVGYIAKWNGLVWQDLGSGLGGQGRSLAIGPRGEVYVVGSFSTMAGSATACAGAAIWTGTNWVFPDFKLTNATSDTPYVILVPNDTDLYIAGEINQKFFSSAATLFNNPGSAQTWPILLDFQGSSGAATLYWLKNYTTGKTLYFNFQNLPYGEVSILTYPKERKMSEFYRGEITSSILRGSDLSEFFLIPGDNLIGLFAYELDTSGEYAETVIEVPIAHWSLDGAAA